MQLRIWQSKEKLKDIDDIQFTYRNNSQNCNSVIYKKVSTMFIPYAHLYTVALCYVAAATNAMKHQFYIQGKMHVYCLLEQHLWL